MTRVPFPIIPIVLTIMDATWNNRRILNCLSILFCFLCADMRFPGGMLRQEKKLYVCKFKPWSRMRRDAFIVPNARPRVRGVGQHLSAYLLPPGQTTTTDPYDDTMRSLRAILHVFVLARRLQRIGCTTTQAHCIREPVLSASQLTRLGPARTAYGKYALTCTSCWISTWNVFQKQEFDGINSQICLII